MISKKSIGQNFGAGNTGEMHMKQKRIGAPPLPDCDDHYDRKTWRSQRVRRGFADYDAWNADDYLLHVIPGMIRYLAEHGHGYHERYWSFDEEKQIENDSYEAYKAELLKVADALDRLSDTVYTDEMPDEERHALQLRCFTWLGHNLGMLWD